MLELSQLHEQFDARTLQRGKKYAKEERVTHIEKNKQNRSLFVKSMVRGTRLYHVAINVGASNRIIGHCTCPVGENCKHVVATLMTVIAEQDNSAPENLLYEQPNYQLTSWMNTFDSILNPKLNQQTDEFVVYLLSNIKIGPDLHVMLETHITRVLKKGGYAKPKSFHPSTPKNKAKVTEKEMELFAKLDLYFEDNYYSRSNEYILTGKHAAIILDDLIDTGRCYWSLLSDQPLKKGTKVRGKLAFDVSNEGGQSIACHLPSESLIILPLSPLCYVNTDSLEVGHVETDCSDEISAQLYAMPEIPPRQANNFSKLMKDKFPKESNLPVPRTFEKVLKMESNPIPRLYIYTKNVKFSDTDNYALHFVDIFMAELSFNYGDYNVDYGDERHDINFVNGNTYCEFSRNREFEDQQSAALENYDLISFWNMDECDFPELKTDDLYRFFYIAKGDDFESKYEFYKKVAPELEKQGWVIEFAEGEEIGNLLEIENWYTKLDESSGNNWFSLELGVVADGKEINLVPFILEAIQHIKFDEEGDDEEQMKDLILKLPEGDLLPLPFERIKQILTTLKQFINPARETDTNEIKLSIAQAGLLAEMDKAFQETKLRWIGDTKLLELGKRLANFKGISKVRVPASLKADLRPYQKDGLDWLQFLRKYQLNGILADDMGLGKTVQTLAHLLVEKHKKRFTKPCLIISPTSVITNWENEIGRFSPDLSVLKLHGQDRKHRFSEILNHDIVLTTYPLMLRDKDDLLENEFYFIILDESQYIKNAQAKITQIVMQLKGDHRLCLSGTPLENHLGELWSQFNFLMPGLLGNARQFKREYRTPIEKNQDEEARKRLSRMVRPFILRRTKEEVLTDLPEKTEVITHIEFENKQRDIYEGIRLAMHDRVQKAINERGIDRCGIIIIDALLKLRQICCDPRLLKTNKELPSTDSAKLTVLIEMLIEMIEEGRRVLLFSQFTSMLALIEVELDKNDIKYVKLTGSTKDRATPIKQFQDGEVPLFLISLRAGGTGLNLTTADTIIHFDPWWNPAVERQASDRAHRIGQKNPVFVYKLVVKNTVEEKILEIQDKKKNIADSIFSEKGKLGKISRKDIDRLFSNG